MSTACWRRGDVDGVGWWRVFIAGRLPIRQLPSHDFSQCGHFIVAEMPALKKTQRQFPQSGLPFRFCREISGRNQMRRDHLAERFRHLVDVNAGEAGIRRRQCAAGDENPAADPRTAVHA